MTKDDILKFICKNPIFFLATTEDNQPRVRGMLLYKADKDGILFHTSKIKDIYSQVEKNNKVELCFNGQNMQIRISGELEVVDDIKLKDEISDHPSRKFLKSWKESVEVEEFYNNFVVFRLTEGLANIWTMENNFEPKTYVEF